MRKKQNQAALAAACSAVVENLEERRLLSATLFGTALYIQGDNNTNVMSLSVNANNSQQLVVNIDSNVQVFSRSQVNSIVWSTGQGLHNFAMVDEANGTIDIPITAYLGNGADTFVGGSGNDSVVCGSGGDSVIGGAGNDTILGNVGNDTLRGGRDVDQIYGSDGNDLLYGGMGNDIVGGMVGNDTLYGGQDNDLVMGGQGNDQVYGAAGNDTVQGGKGDDVVAGDAEDQFQFIDGSAPTAAIGNDLMRGGQGNDTLMSHTGSDTIFGGRGPDGEVQGDVFDARAGDDFIMDRDAQVQPLTSENVINGTVRADITANIKIYVNDGSGVRQVWVPNTAGHISSTQINKIEAVDGNGNIRFRNTVPIPSTGELFQLNEFFQQWGISFSSNHIGRYKMTNGMNLTMTVNGAINNQLGDYYIQNGDQIVTTLT